MQGEVLSTRFITDLCGFYISLAARVCLLNQFVLVGIIQRAVWYWAAQLAFCSQVLN